MCLQKEIRTNEPEIFVRHFGRGTRGIALVEFAMVVPILMTLLIGTFWIGRAVSVYQALERAAREGARVAIAPSCASCRGTGGNDSDVNSAINGALAAAAIDTSNPDLQIHIDRNEGLNPSDPVNYQASAVEVTVSYPMQLSIPFTSKSATKITLSSTVSMRQEY
jgi:Flp pilus assembly protein TadG